MTRLRLLFGGVAGAPGGRGGAVTTGNGGSKLVGVGGMACSAAPAKVRPERSAPQERPPPVAPARAELEAAARLRRQFTPGQHRGV
jgi:hypothetical protein